MQNALLPASLSWRQTARLALSIAVIYWPIRLYLNTASLEPGLLAPKLPFFIAEIGLTFLFFWGWIGLIDGLLDWLKTPPGLLPANQKTGEGSLLAQLATLLVAVGLALLLNNVFGRLHQRMDDGLTQKFLAPQYPTLPDSVAAHRAEGGDGRRRMNNGLTVMALLSAYYLTASRRSGQQMQALGMQAEQLAKEAAQAQLAALRNQVNPHFLFNSLSILSSLVEVNPKLSVQFINQLSKVYRYILDQRDAEQVPFRTELDFIESYTFLLCLRFDNRLRVQINVSDTDRDRYQIAPLTLQLLVENAVKHNRMSDDAPLLVSIDREGDYLRITNPLQFRPSMEASTGMGLTNIVNRYQLLSDLPVWVGEAHGEFIVKIPLLNG